MDEYTQNAVPIMMLKVSVKNTEDQKFYFCSSSETLPSVLSKYTKQASHYLCSIVVQGLAAGKAQFLVEGATHKIPPGQLIL